MAAVARGRIGGARNGRLGLMGRTHHRWFGAE